MNFRGLFEKVSSDRDLTIPESKAAVSAMMEGSWQPSQIGVFLKALHQKGESAEELAGFALAMREKAVPVPLDGRPTLDTCGTGGDKKGSFNISSLAAFVLAGSGIPIVKHGNRAATSSCGSADLLEALGMRYRLHPEEAAEALRKIGFAFLFAPDYHPATKSVVAVRKQLETPTIFNLLGPLTNPVSPLAQLIGVYDRSAVPLMAEAIRKIDEAKRAVLLHSEEGWDEATPCGNFLLHPTFGQPSIENAVHFGFSRCESSELRGGTPLENARIAMAILAGERGPKRETVLLNALLAYLVFHPNSTPQEALYAVRESIDSGAALQVVLKYRERFPGEAK